MYRFRVSEMNYIILFLLFLNCSYVMATDVENVQLIGKEFITQKPMFYKLNQPWYKKLPSDLQGYAPAYFKYNRVLDDDSIRCSNCLNKKTLLTPLRIEYLPSGTTLRVKGIFTHRSRNTRNGTNFFVIEDMNGQLSETRAIGFEKTMSQKYDSSDLARKDPVVAAADLYGKGEAVTLTTCDPEKIDKLNLIREDFSLKDDIASKVSSQVLAGKNCTDFEFTNLTAYATYRHFQEDWGSEIRRSNSKVESCVETPTDQNKGGILCENVIFKMLNQDDPIALEKVFKGWRLTKGHLQSLEMNLKFKTWSPSFQLSIIEAGDEREVLISTCKKISDPDQRINCYLENSACHEFYGLRQRDCNQQKIQETVINETHVIRNGI